MYNFLNFAIFIFIKRQRPLTACGGCVSKKMGKMHRSLRSIHGSTGCPRTGSPEKTGICRQQKRLQID
jgi:hypothetical protein